MILYNMVSCETFWTHFTHARKMGNLDFVLCNFTTIQPNTPISSFTPTHAVTYTSPLKKQEIILLQ